MGRRLATLRLDGFIGLKAPSEDELGRHMKPEDRGSLVTKPFELRGSRLEVNIEAPQGEFEVWVLDAAGNPIPRFYQTLRDVDEVRFQPHWNFIGELKDLMGQTIRLKFRLEEGTLYAFQIRP